MVEVKFCTPLCSPGLTWLPPGGLELEDELEDIFKLANFLLFPKCAVFSDSKPSLPCSSQSSFQNFLWLVPLLTQKQVAFSPAISHHHCPFLIYFHSSKMFVFICCCSVAKLCPTLSDPMDCSTPGLPVLHCFYIVV